MDYRPLVERIPAREIPMYDQAKLSELIGFSRIDAGFTADTTLAPP